MQGSNYNLSDIFPLFALFFGNANLLFANATLKLHFPYTVLYCTWLNTTPN